MNPFEAIVIIAVFAIIASVIKNKHNNQSQSTEPSSHQDDHVEQMQAQIMDLKKRVETLEAIVTDKSYNLKKDIDNL